MLDAEVWGRGRREGTENGGEGTVGRGSGEDEVRRTRKKKLREAGRGDRLIGRRGRCVLGVIVKRGAELERLRDVGMGSK